MPNPKKPPETTILRQIKVRRIVPEERDRFDQALKDLHYLHSARLGGQSLRYVAELNGEWVALIAFSGFSAVFLVLLAIGLLRWRGWGGRSARPLSRYEVLRSPAR